MKNAKTNRRMLEHRRAGQKHRLAIALVVGALGGLSAMAMPCAAQMVPGPPGVPNQAPQNPAAVPQPSFPSIGLPGTQGFGTTPALPPATSPTPGAGMGKSFGTAGRGLPGMPGGPPLTSPLGAQDPSSRYMRPVVIGPLFCDPSLNIDC